MKKGRCKCGCNRFETIDITPYGRNTPQYFIRCKKCGLIIFSSPEGSQTSSCLNKLLVRYMGFAWKKA